MHGVSSIGCTITCCCCDTLDYTVSERSTSMSLPHFMFIGQVRAAGRRCAAPAGKGGFQR